MTDTRIGPEGFPLHPPGRDLPQVADDLAAAADLLDRDGWGRFSYYNPDRNCHCALGAVIAIMGGDNGPLSLPSGTFGRFSDAVQVLAEQLTRNPSPDSHYAQGVVASWNDSSLRTRDQVTAQMRAAAARVAAA